MKNGPNAGQVRARKNDGRWREKRSDAGKPREKKGEKTQKNSCFLTTAACSYKNLPDNCAELETMRAFRDDVLLTSVSGREIVTHYYDIAPSLVPLLDDPIIAERVWSGIKLTISHIESGRISDAVSSYRGVVAGLLEEQTKPPPAPPA